MLAGLQRQEAKGIKIRTLEKTRAKERFLEGWRAKVERQKRRDISINKKNGLPIRRKGKQELKKKIKVTLV